MAMQIIRSCRPMKFKITSTGPVFGEIVSSGKLMDREGRRLAGFRQTTRAWRGSRVLELEIELDIDRQPGPNPWNSYYACRFAWRDETCNIYRSVNQTTQPTELTQFESPHFVDIRTRTASHHDIGEWIAISSTNRTAETRYFVDRSRRNRPVVPAGRGHRSAECHDGGDWFYVAED